MASSKDIWYHLGHAYERARSGAEEPRKGVVGLAERKKAERANRSEAHEVAWPSADELFSAGALLVLDRLVGGRKRQPGLLRLVRAGAAGAAAAFLVDLIRPLLHGDASLPVLDRRTGDRVLAGLGQGLVYGALVEPRIPGPALVKGALYGSVEYAVDPLGGLATLFGGHTPQGRMPVVGELLDGLDAHDRAFLEHVIFGIALAILYEASPSSNGIPEDDE